MLRLCRTCRLGAYAPRRTLATAATAGPDLPPRRPQAQLQRPDRAGRERDRFRSPNNKLRLADILQTLAKYKAENRSPTPVAYINIIEAASEFALGHKVDGDQADGLGFQVALAAWEDAKRGGVELGQEGIDAMMNFAVIYPHLLSSLLLYTKNRRLATYNAMARVAASSFEVEQMIYLLEEMSQQGFVPNTTTLKHTIRQACEWGYPRLALQIAQKAEEESSFGFRLDQSAWVQILIASADNHYLHGVETAWERVKSSYTPDEGLILSMLNAAGRWGRPDFSSTILELLPGPPQEHHLGPLLEAFCNAGQVPNAFHVLSTIRSTGLTPTLSSIQPIVNVLKSAEVIDQAYYTLEDMHKSGQAVDITALNAVIAASSAIGDLQRARATQSAIPEFGVTPTIDTYNCVLQCCVTTSHRALGDTLLSEMAAQDIQPNATTYDYLINLCLTQPAYEDAFYYLEKMKADGFKPGYSVYAALVKKCVKMGDSRWRLVVDEMKDVGHKVEYELQGFINSGGKQRGGSRQAAGQRRANDEMVGSKRRSWIKQATEDAA
ncbi:hypothetical protein I314_05787 [Cryptococcus bacillisporus CA1873]|uniref:Pentatricopeptide repeat-containing protein-mitochondrial domain-containing protein n=1 Tax=Cryptococcus bacillisporus CA1873 TaxID=1296111 RepID=A0ABR5B4N7_CRYGA|nr:hypothetical protein I314_05787 [Cryptococcus bacillisporus CA1873]|eukprot:KIR58539.1 hypothetical protein I314_05787 [Cryptococcus gattii CA1873]